MDFDDEWGHFDLLQLDFLEEQENFEELNRQEPEQEETVNRKGPKFVPVTNEEKENFVKDMKNKNTVRKTISTMNIFNQWLAKENITTEIWQMEPAFLDPLIGSFLLALRKTDGSEYEPDTLTSYHRGIDRFLRENHYKWSIVVDREFESSRSVLAAKRKQLKQKGKGNRPNAAEPLTTSDKQKLQDQGLLGLDSPEKLLNVLWLNKTTMFGLRGGTENRNLKWGDIELKQTNAGREYLEYKERITKTRTGEKKTEVRAFAPKQFSHEDKNSCPVQAYKEYAKRRPASMLGHDTPFYLSINKLRKHGSQYWFKSQPMSENHIRGLMKSMAEKAGLQGRKTNHSARKTTCTELLHKGVAPTVIQQLTGHKNVQSINNYANASLEMQENMSDILSNNTNAKQPSSVAMLSTAPTQVSTEVTVHPNQNIQSNHLAEYVSKSNQSCRLDKPFSNSVFNNCTITINYAKQADTIDCSRSQVSPIPKRRRILPLIDSDSD